MKNKHRFNHKLKFIVDYGLSTAVRPILGLEACIKLGLIKKLDSIDKSNFINLNIDVFTGTGKINNYKCHLSIKPDAVPTIKPPRRVPLVIKDRLLDSVGG